MKRELFDFLQAYRDREQGEESVSFMLKKRKGGQEGKVSSRRRIWDLTCKVEIRASRYMKPFNLKKTSRLDREVFFRLKLCLLKAIDYYFSVGQLDARWKSYQGQ